VPCATVSCFPSHNHAKKDPISESVTGLRLLKTDLNSAEFNRAFELMQYFDSFDTLLRQVKAPREICEARIISQTIPSWFELDELYLK
jgi:hypothetical protein